VQGDVDLNVPSGNTALITHICEGVGDLMKAIDDVHIYTYIHTYIYARKVTKRERMRERIQADRDKRNEV